MNDALFILTNYWKPCVEIVVFWLGYYVFLKFLRTTGGLQVLRGILLIFVFFGVVRALRLETLSMLMGQILPISVIAFLVLFQSELRRGLTRIGQNPIFKMFIKEEKLIDELVKTVSVMAKKRTGALIALEREMSLKQYTESGILIDGIVSFEVLSTIFAPNTPLHDGGVIIQGSRVQSAGCLFPLSQNPRISKTLGTRHRASIGLTEENDAIVIVVSEETGVISLAQSGELTRELSAEKLRRILTQFYFPKKEVAKTWWATLMGERKHATSS